MASGPRGKTRPAVNASADIAPRHDERQSKHSYTVSCSSAFRDAVEELAARRGVNVADVARSVLLMVPYQTVAAFPDPGEPEARDREEVAVKSGPAEGRPWRRKPRLQVRMAPGFSVETIRRALNLALSLDRGDAEVLVEWPGAAQLPGAGRSLIRETRDELEKLKTLVSVLSFDPLPEGVTTRDEALHVLGLPPGRIPDRATLRARFRMLATIHHPDSSYGNHQRMSQLNAAMDLLRRHAA